MIYKRRYTREDIQEMIYKRRYTREEKTTLFRQGIVAHSAIRLI